MARQKELFPKPKRRSPRVLAKADDHGRFPDGRQAAHFVCARCGWKEWLSCTWTEALRGAACPNCNEGVSYE